MLKQRALSATLWSAADIILRQGLQFAVTIILSHLLTPAEFGTIALLALFIGVATVFVDGGFSAALIQRQDVTHTDESTVFWFNLGIGAIVSFALWIAAPAISAFYGKPILIPLIGVMALNVFFGALGTIHATLLTKRLDFRTQMKVGVIATLVSGGVAVWIACIGYGVWALAAQAVVMTFVSTALLWTFNSWRPIWTFSVPSARKLFGFGGYYFASILLEMTFSRLYTLLIGRYYSVRELGYFNNADSLQQMPGGFLAGVFSRVALPMFSAAANNKATLRRGMQLAIHGMMLLNVPMMMGLMALSVPFVQILFGTPWVPAAPILRILCLGALLWPMHVINLKVLMAQGYSHLFFRLEIVKKALGVAMLGVGAIFGVMAIAWSLALFSVLAFTINAYYSGRFLDYGMVRQLRDFAPVLFLSTVMAAVIYAIGAQWTCPPLLKLAVLVPLGAAIFFAMAWIANLQALQDVLALVRSKREMRTDESSMP